MQWTASHSSGLEVNKQLSQTPESLEGRKQQDRATAWQAATVTAPLLLVPAWTPSVLPSAQLLPAQRQNLIF